MTTLPVVVFLNHLKSSGKCQGILFPAPITRFSDIAAMALKCFIALSLRNAAGSSINDANFDCQITVFCYTTIATKLGVQEFLWLKSRIAFSIPQPHFHR